MIECKICHKQYKNEIGLSAHIRQKHNITSKDYYDLYLKQVSEGLCKNCGSPTTFYSVSKGYLDYCSHKCASNSEETKLKAIETNKERYGVEYTGQINSAKIKRNNTMIKKYGVEHALQSDEFKMKFKNTCLDRYGVEYASKLESTKEKMKNTCLEKYGVEWALQAEVIKEKSKQTCLEKYGVNHPFKTESAQNAYRSTCLEKYGVENPTQSREIKNKIKETNLKKYGVPYYCMTNDCKAASSNDSTPNREFMLLLERNGFSYTDCVTDDTKFYSREFPLENYSYDFKIGNIIIEIDPSPTHNTTWNPFGKNPIDENYHSDKSRLAKINNFQCIHIFDWDDEQKIVNSIKPKIKIYARNCHIKPITQKDCNDFLDMYHFQNSCRNQIICLGLFLGEKLLSVMTFGKPRYNKNYDYELLRLCTKFGYLIIGGSEKLFKYFIKNYNPQSIISYCDLAKFNGDVYKKLNFKLQSSIKPSKHWYNIKTKKHITDNLLRQRGFDQLFGTDYGKGASNEKLMLDAGFVEIYDCGQASYSWKNKEEM